MNAAAQQDQRKGAAARGAHGRLEAAIAKGDAAGKLRF